MGSLVEQAQALVDGENSAKEELAKAEATLEAAKARHQEELKELQAVADMPVKEVKGWLTKERKALESEIEKRSKAIPEGDDDDIGI